MLFGEPWGGRDMSGRSKIEWTDATWNPVRGCTKISPGCAHCYAETFAERFRGVPGHPYEHAFDLRLVPEKLGDPLRWSKPKMIFVNSMSDLFHAGVPTSVHRMVVPRAARQMAITSLRGEEVPRPHLSVAPCQHSLHSLGRLRHRTPEQDRGHIC